MKNWVNAMLCGLMVACGGARQLPSARPTALGVCPGGAAHGDAELIPYQSCALISGDLELTGVTSLAPLSELRGVRGRLTIARTELESLAGLEQLATVGGIEVRDNVDLSSAVELGHLRHADEIELQGNPGLKALNGFSGVATLHRLSVRRNGLLSLSGLEGLRRVDILELVDNPKLIDPRALNDVREAGRISVTHNPRLTSQFGLLAGLEHVEKVSLFANAGLGRFALSANCEGERCRERGGLLRSDD